MRHNRGYMLPLDIVFYALYVESTITTVGHSLPSKNLPLMLKLDIGGWQLLSLSPKLTMYLTLIMSVVISTLGIPLAVRDETPLRRLLSFRCKFLLQHLALLLFYLPFE